MTPRGGKIGPDDIKDLKVKFCSEKEIKVQEEITIMIRGSKIMKLPFNA